MDALRGDTRFEVIVASFVSETDHNRPCSALTALSVSPSAADTVGDSSRGLTLKSVRLAFFSASHFFRNSAGVFLLEGVKTKIGSTLTKTIENNL